MPLTAAAAAARCSGRRARQTIAELGSRFIRSNATVLTHGFSRVVLRLLQQAFSSVSPAAAGQRRQGSSRGYARAAGRGPRDAAYGLQAPPLAGPPPTRALCTRPCRAALPPPPSCRVQGLQFSVIVTEGRPDGTGLAMARKLDGQGIPVTLVLDSAAASIMHDRCGQDVRQGRRSWERRCGAVEHAAAACPTPSRVYSLPPLNTPSVDMVLVGADAVVENGGIINKLGTYGIALAAQVAAGPGERGGTGEAVGRTCSSLLGAPLSASWPLSGRSAQPRFSLTLSSLASTRARLPPRPPPPRPRPSPSTWRPRATSLRGYTRWARPTCPRSAARWTWGPCCRREPA
jgi:hypothetical protein